MTNYQQQQSKSSLPMAKCLEESNLYKILLIVCILHFTLMSYQNFTKSKIKLRNIEVDMLLQSAMRAIEETFSISNDIIEFKHSRRVRSMSDLDLVHGAMSSISKLIDSFDQIVDSNTGPRKSLQEYPVCKENKLQKTSVENVVALVSKIISEELDILFEPINNNLPANQKDSHSAETNDDLNKKGKISVMNTNGLLKKMVTKHYNLFPRIFSLLNLPASHEMTLKRLGTEFHLHLNLALNPHDCLEHKVIICNFSQGNLQAAVHKIAYCMALAFSTRRVLVLTPYWPWRSCVRNRDINSTAIIQLGTTRDVQSALRDLSENWMVAVNASRRRLPIFSMPLSQILENRIMGRVRYFHQKPEAWVIGQIISYILNPLISKNSFSKEVKRINFRYPIVGVYVDQSEDSGKYFSKYIEGVEKFYHDFKHKVLSLPLRRVLLVSRDSKAYHEAEAYTSRFTFIRRRDTEGYESANLTDIYNMYLLARCNFLVCDMSRSPCRMTYELMQTIQGDATNKVHAVRGHWRF